MAHVDDKTKAAGEGTAAATEGNIEQRVQQLEKEVAVLSLTKKLDQLFLRVARLEEGHIAQSH